MRVFPKRRRSRLLLAGVAVAVVAFAAVSLPADQPSSRGLVEVADGGVDATAVPRSGPCEGEAAEAKCAEAAEAATTEPSSEASGSGGEGGEDEAAEGGGSGPATAAGRGGFPNAASAGVPAGWQPVAVHEGDLWVRDAGTVIEGLHVTGSIQVRADDVTIRNTKVDDTIWNQESDRVQYSGLLIEDTEVGPDQGVSSSSDGAIGTSGYTARRVEIHGFTDGFRVAGANVRIEDSFVVLSELAGGCPHLDGIQGYGGGADVVVRHNTIDARGSCSTSAVFMAEASPHIDLRDNLLLGGAYSIHLNQYEVPTVFAVHGNRVVEGSYDYGPSEVLDSGALTLTCSGNRLVTIDAAYQVTGDRGPFDC
jgi:hypothetical protein